MNTSPAEHSFYRWLRSLGLTRSRDRWVGGVASGLAERAGLDSILMRGIVALVILFTGLGLLVYGAAWALLPGPNGRIHLQEAARGAWSKGFVGALVVFAFGLFGWFRPWHGMDFDSGFDFGDIIAIAVVGLVIWFFVSRARRPQAKPGTAPAANAARATNTGTGTEAAATTAALPASEAHTVPLAATASAAEQPGVGDSVAGGDTTSSYSYNYSYAPKPPKPLKPMRRALGAGGTSIWLGLAVLAGAGIFLADLLTPDALGIGWPLPVALAVALGVLGLGLVSAAISQRSGGALTGWTVVALIATLVFGGWNAVDNGPWRGEQWRNGDGWAHTWVDEETGERGYAFSEQTVDLTHYGDDLTEDETVRMSLAFNDTTIRVPDNVTVWVDSRNAFSELTVTNESTGIQDYYDDISGPRGLKVNDVPDAPELRLILNGAFNEVRIDIIDMESEAVTP